MRNLFISNGLRNFFCDRRVDLAHWLQVGVSVGEWRPQRPWPRGSFLDPAASLTPLFQILLVIILGWVELLGGGDLSNDLVLVLAAFGQGGQ